MFIFPVFTFLLCIIQDSKNNAGKKRKLESKRQWQMVFFHFQFLCLWLLEKRRHYVIGRVIKNHSVEGFWCQCPCAFSFLCSWIMCNPFQGSNSLQGANNLFREIENSLRGAKNLFWEIENSLRLSLLKSGPITMLVDKSSKVVTQFL